MVTAVGCNPTFPEFESRPPLFRLKGENAVCKIWKNFSLRFLKMKSEKEKITPIDKKSGKKSVKELVDEETKKAAEFLPDIVVEALGGS